MVKKIKSPIPKSHSGNVGLSRSDEGVITIDYPVFCFRHLQKGYTLQNCITHSNKKFLKGLVKRIETLTNSTWHEIQYVLRKESGGAEKIDSKSILQPIPAVATGDVITFLSIRFAGSDCRMIGFRGDEIFHVLYIDTTLSVYRHS